MVVNTIRRALRDRLCKQGSINLSEDEVYGLLSVERRREVILYLAENLGTMDTVEIRDLSDYIAAIEQDKDPNQLTTDERHAVYVALYQDHLPKLDDAGVVEYDPRASTIARGEDIDALAQLIGTVERASAAASSAARYPLTVSAKQSSVSDTYAV